jgi:iron-sulfur cluster repair protein YtfE (RIC family)
MKRPEPARRGSGQSPTDPGLLARPLDFISEDHLRERQVCADIDGLVATAVFNRHAGVTILRFLNEELGVHFRDEAEDLFPILAKRCTEEDAIDTVLGRIRQDQDNALSLLPAVRGAIAHCLDAGADLTSEDREVLTRFAAHVRRHLVAENAILLPIARARLTRGDLRRLADHMRSRRGISTVSENTHAD